MFEKEAEDSFKDGATFGFNKANEWHKKDIDNIYDFIAEIGEQRRMTNKELSRWLRENPTREYKYYNDSWVFSYYEYKEGCEEEEVSEKIRIRENYGEWREPLVENESICSVKKHC